MTTLRRVLHRSTIVVCTALGAALLLFGLITMLFGCSFVFYPSPAQGDETAAARAAGLPVTDVALFATDDTKLHAWFSTVPDARAALLFLHGNAGTVANRTHLVRALRTLPLDVLILDYRGYGQSSGSPSEKGVYADAEAGYRWLRARGYGPDRILLYGESLGGAVAIETACRVPVAGLIVQSTFTSIGDMARRVVPGIPLGWLLPVKMKSAEKIRSLKVPKLHFHGEEDDVVPFAMGKALFEAAAPPKRFVAFKNVAHNDWPGSYEAQWLTALQEFLDQTVPDRR